MVCGGVCCDVLEGVRVWCSVWFCCCGIVVLCVYMYMQEPDTVHVEVLNM